MGGADHQRRIPVGEHLARRPTKLHQALGQQPQRRGAGGVGGKAHRHHPGEPQHSDQRVQGAQLFADQPLAAVGPVGLDLDAGVGLKADLGIGLGVDRAQQANAAGERGIGTRIAELLDLPVQRRGPQLGMDAKPAGDVGRLRRRQLRRPGPGSLPRHGLCHRVAAGGPPGDVELPGDPRDRPPMALVQRVHHDPVLLTLQLTLLPGSRLRHRNRGRRDRPFLGTDKAPGTARGLCTLRDQDSANFMITDTGS
jgi:hypothetical protein